MIAMRVFVSYSALDIHIARSAADTIRAMGLDPWMDVYHLPYTPEWRGPILRAIEESVAFVALVTDSYLVSEQCRVECEHAMAISIPIIEACYAVEDGSKNYVRQICSERLHLSRSSGAEGLTGSTVLMSCLTGGGRGGGGE
jgi:hypothetical protein